MFWNKLKTFAAVILAGGLFAGTALLAYRSAGQEQGRPPAPQDGVPAKDGSAAQPHPNARSSAGVQSLSPRAKARLDVAKKLRDLTFQRRQIDPSAEFADILAAQNRYDEVVAEVLVNTEADRVRFMEHRLATLKRIEQYITDLFKGAQVGRIDVLAAELYRLEAEDRLEKAGAKLGASGAAQADTASRQLVEFLNQDTWDPRIGKSAPHGPPP
jgi:hypothetical protein